jgi:hypothetical protein
MKRVKLVKRGEELFSGHFIESVLIVSQICLQQQEIKFAKHSGQKVQIFCMIKNTSFEPVIAWKLVGSLNLVQTQKFLLILSG